jgi:hypothetical protein
MHVKLYALRYCGGNEAEAWETFLDKDEYGGDIDSLVDLLTRPLYSKRIKQPHPVGWKWIDLTPKQSARPMPEDQKEARALRRAEKLNVQFKKLVKEIINENR